MRFARVAALASAAAIGLTPQLASAITVDPSAMLGSDAAVDGTRLAVSGSGFTSNTTLTIRMGADVVAGGKGGACTNYPADYCRWSVSSNDSGAFSTTVVVPLGMKGPVDVDVQDHVAHTTTSAGQFTATQVPIRLHLSDTRPRAGSTITITGGGCYPSSSVRLYVNSRLLAVVPTSSTGRFTYDYKLSAWTRGSNLIRVQDTFIHQFAAKQFIVP